MMLNSINPIKRICFLSFTRPERCLTWRANLCDMIRNKMKVFVMYYKYGWLLLYKDDESFIFKA